MKRKFSAHVQKNIHKTTGSSTAAFPQGTHEVDVKKPKQKHWQQICVPPAFAATETHAT